MKVLYFILYIMSIYLHMQLGITPLNIASLMEHTDIVSLLITYGATDEDNNVID